MVDGPAVGVTVGEVDVGFTEGDVDSVFDGPIVGWFEGMKVGGKLGIGEGSAVLMVGLPVG